jgi:hypothetical protein
MVVHACNPSTQELEAGQSRSAGLHCETMSQKQEQNKETNKNDEANG